MYLPRLPAYQGLFLVFLLMLIKLTVQHILPKHMVLFIHYSFIQLPLQIPYKGYVPHFRLMGKTMQILPFLLCSV